MRNYPIHSALTIASLGVVLACTRMLTPAQFRAIVDFAPDRVPFSPVAHPVETAAVPAPAPVPARVLRSAEPSLLLEDSGGVLDRFYDALWRTEKHQEGAVTRVVHYGDSPTTADLITGDVRAQLQARYGDAGHGFILIAKPWAWYQHSGVELAGSGWQMLPASRFESRDGMFGLAGVSFTGSGSARTRIVWNEPQTAFSVWYLRQPGGGVFTVSAGQQQLGRVDTAGDGKQPGFAVFAAEPSRALEIHIERGSVRLFGVTAERSGPGVVYDSLGLNGASITVLSRMFGEQHWSEELRHRNPNLVIVNYGTNEADFASFVDKQYEKELREALRRIHAALPDASILVMSPMDRGRHAGAEIETMETIPKLVAIQRRVARETGCGFFDTFAAMGGTGTMARWYTGKPRLVSADLIHPYPAGGKMIATAFTQEIGSGLNRFKLRRSTAPAPAAPATARVSVPAVTATVH